MKQFPNHTGILSAFGELGDVFKTLNQNIGSSFCRIGEAIQEFERRFPASVKTLAREGWFISIWHTDFFAIAKIADLIRRGEAETANEAMCLHFENISDEIMKSMEAGFPDRHQIVRKAVKAHCEGEYELSIPVFLAQADGCWHDFANCSIYSKRSDARQVMESQLAKLDEERFTDPFFELLREDLAISRNTRRTSYTGTLNRHAVMHGIQTDYGTRLNSYRAMSWMYYVIQVVEEISREERQAPEVPGAV